MKFYKYHALGNDYVVLDPRDQPLALTPDQIKAICHRHYGIGSDGILLGPLPSTKAPFLLRIFNPDGSEAEKSGNGHSYLLSLSLGPQAGRQPNIRY